MLQIQIKLKIMFVGLFVSFPILVSTPIVMAKKNQKELACETIQDLKSAYLNKAEKIRFDAKDAYFLRILKMIQIRYTLLQNLTQQNNIHFETKRIVMSASLSQILELVEINFKILHKKIKEEDLVSKLRSLETEVALQNKELLLTQTITPQKESQLLSSENRHSSYGYKKFGSRILRSISLLKEELDENPNASEKMKNGLLLMTLRYPALTDHLFFNFNALTHTHRSLLSTSKDWNRDFCLKAQSIGFNF